MPEMRLINILKALALFVLMIIPGNCYSPPEQIPAVGVEAEEQGKPVVAVKLMSDVKEVFYSNEMPFTIVCMKPDSAIEEYFSISRITIKNDYNGLSVHDSNYGKLSSNLTSVYFRQTTRSGVGRIGGNGYRGRIYIIPGKKKGTISVLNRLDVDNYLKGVLPAEMGVRRDDEYESLKAMAVAARTYALHKIQRGGGKGLLESTIMDQVYRGFDNEYYAASRAVDETSGEVLKYGDKLIQVQYFAVCGGRTERIEDVWGGDSLPYYRVVNDGDYCAWAKSYFWEEEFSRELLERRLNTYFINKYGEPLPGNLKDIKVLKRSRSGRVKLLKIYTTQTQVELYADKIRVHIGTVDDPSKRLPSTLFELDVERDAFGDLRYVRFIGRGNGHGIGMCQCGAIGRARAGYNYRQILQKYYPGTSLEKLY
ncbi:MAG: SpoIID/LytB domain-containing protein [candidate division Zixibacteria bacterium]|nr:SpoIID/LytB domain-containing protein [candidate division Zixibacteria bacterium]